MLFQSPNFVLVSTLFLCHDVIKFYVYIYGCKDTNFLSADLHKFTQIIFLRELRTQAFFLNSRAASFPIHAAVLSGEAANFSASCRAGGSKVAFFFPI